MALRKSREIPKDAVELEEVEAIEYVWEIVSNWESLGDTWALRYGPMLLGGVNAIAGIMINNHYRTKLKLGAYGYFSSVIPISAMPCVLTALFHRHVIATDMLLMKNVCPMCYEVRAAGIQLGMGIVYPMVLGPAAALMFAQRYSTYRVPDLFEGPKVIFNFLRQKTRPLKGTLVGLSVLQLVASSIITYCEMRNNIRLRDKIMDIEKKVLAEIGDT